MKPFIAHLVCALLCVLPLHGSEVLGAEKLKVFEGKIPDLLNRTNIGIGQKVKFQLSYTFLPDPNDSPERKQFFEKRAFQYEFTKEVVSTNASEMTTATVSQGKRTENTQPRKSSSSKEGWE